MSKLKPTFNVTAAIIRLNDKILICQRPKNKSFGLLWEFPGGKIEPNETPEACIKRECLEELNIVLADVEFFCNTEHEFPDKIIKISFFKATIKDIKQLKVKEHNKIAWVSMLDLNKYHFCPNDAEMLEAYNDLL